MRFVKFMTGACLHENQKLEAFGLCLSPRLKHFFLFFGVFAWMYVCMETDSLKFSLGLSLFCSLLFSFYVFA